MKKIFLTMALAITSILCSQAAGPVYFEADFANADAWPGGWTTKGCGAELMDAIKDIWGDAGTYKIVEFPNKGTFACSTSDFQDSSIQADEWLITPTIHVTEERALLCFSAAATNIAGIGLNSNSYKVRISTEGPDPEKFEEKALGNYVINGRIDNIVIELTGYKDKDINIAFINDSKQPGVIGFGNIYVGSYYINLINNTVEYITPTTVKMQAKLRTPYSALGFKAELIANNQTISTYESTEQLYGDYKTFDIVFPNKIEVDAATTDELAYEVKITPNYLDAEEYVYNSSVKSSINYTTKVVVEECTGTWCQFCPRGAVSLDYYSSKYPDTFLGIAVHGATSGVTEPMAFGSPTQYIIPLGGNEGFPLGRINRHMDFFYNFGDGVTVQPYFEEICVNKIDIKELKFDATTMQLDVKYDARLGYNADNRAYNVVAVVTEDNVTGDTSDYDQMNAYHAYTAEEISDEYGLDWLPYWKHYIGRTSVSIKARDMVYNHVARALYPSFKGELIGTKWEKDQAVEGSLSFTLPKSIQDMKNTKINLLMTDANGLVVTYASKHIESVGIDNVAANDYNACINGSTLVISAEPGATAEVYSADGRKIYSADMKYSSTGMNISGLKGVHIVRIAGQNGTKTYKFMF